MTELAEKSISELTVEYNRQVEEKIANHTGLKPLPFKPVKGFKDKTTALRRIAELNGEVPPAKAKPAKKAAAPKVKPAAKKAAAPKVKREPKEKLPQESRLSDEFGFKGGGERDLLLAKLTEPRLGRQVPRAEFGELGKFMSKIKLRIARKKLAYKLVKEKKDDGTVTYGLHNK